ncbi:MAG: sugar phosphate isomerase/epimerase [Kiritimatiellae bacterium]|nr:sugar phosphate isomerase/epimerase [Kiritimatiellia bacterium]MDD5520272.1 sugar phosphate isomerase/epimerase [Kiritimatiellia bacterium]
MKYTGNSFFLLILVVAFSGETASGAESSLPNPFFAMDTCAPTTQMDLLKELGYSGFSWAPGNIDKVIQDAKTRGLKVFSVYTGSKLGKEKFEGNHESTIASLKGTDVIIWLTIVSKDYVKSSPDGDTVAIPALQVMADNAASNNVRIALYPHTGFWVEKVQDAVRVAKKVNRPNFGVTFNLCHCLMVGDEEKIPELLTEAMPHLFLVTINGADTGAGRTKWDRLIRPLDEGTKDLLPILKKLRELGYHGPIGLQGYAVKLPAGENIKRSWTAWQKLNERLAKENK